MFSNSCYANVNTTFECFTYTPQLWLIDIGYGMWSSLLKLSKELWYRTQDACSLTHLRG
jgi:hypothetical protein